MSRETDKTLFNAGLGTYKPGRFGRKLAGELIDSVREDDRAGTLTPFGYEGLHDLVAGLIGNIEELDRELEILREVLSHERSK